MYFILFCSDDTHQFFSEAFSFFIAGIGTPCFLAITGYLLYSNDEKRELEKCRKWAQKCFMLALFCNIVYGIALPVPLSNYTDIMFLLKLLLLGNQICGVLWYLTALCWGLLIFAVIRKYFPRFIYALPFLFVILYIIRNTTDPNPLFDFTIGRLNTNERNSFLTSLTFLSTGYLIRKHYNALSRIKVEITAIILLITAFIEHYCYRHFFGVCGLFHISTYPLIISLFILCIKYSDFKLPLLNHIGKVHSPNIYYFHILIASTVWCTLPLKGFSDWQAPIVWLMCIPLSSMMLIFIRNRAKKLITRLHEKFRTS